VRRFAKALIKIYYCLNFSQSPATPGRVNEESRKPALRPLPSFGSFANASGPRRDALAVTRARSGIHDSFRRRIYLRSSSELRNSAVLPLFPQEFSSFARGTCFSWQSQSRYRRYASAASSFASSRVIHCSPSASARFVTDASAERVGGGRVRHISHKSARILLNVAAVRRRRLRRPESPAKNASFAHRAC